jgi:hypothetical protein
VTSVYPTATLAFPLRKARFALVLAVALVLFLVSSLTAVAGLAGPGSLLAWELGIAGLVGTVIFGAATFFIALKLFSGRPGLVIDQEGIVDNTSYSSVGRVPWSEIAWVQIQSLRLPTYNRSLLFRPQQPRIMVIGVRDPEQFRRQGNRLQRFLRRGTVGMFGGPVAISESLLRADLDDLARRIRAGVPVS